MRKREFKQSSWWKEEPEKAKAMAKPSKKTLGRLEKLKNLERTLLGQEDLPEQKKAIDVDSMDVKKILEEISSRLKALDENTAKVANKVTGVEQKMSSMDQALEEMSQSIFEIDNKLEKLEAKIQNMQKEYEKGTEKMEKDVKKIEAAVENSKSQIKYFSGRLLNQENEVMDLKSQMIYQQDYTRCQNLTVHESEPETPALTIYVHNMSWEDVTVTCKARPWFRLLDGNVVFFWYKWLASLFPTTVCPGQKKKVNNITDWNLITYYLGRYRWRLYNINEGRIGCQLCHSIGLHLDRWREGDIPRR